jgi:hypothetical protein
VSVTRVARAASPLCGPGAAGAAGLTARGAAPTPAAGTRTADPADLPTGTVAFLFTDLAGSTRQLEAHPAAFRGAVARHHALLQQAVEALLCAAGQSLKR